MRTKPKNPILTERANRELDKIVRYCAAHPGTVGKIREDFRRVTGVEVRRENFERWLRQDPGLRNEPLFGAGLLLLESAKRVMGKAGCCGAGKSCV